MNDITHRPGASPRPSNSILLNSVHFRVRVFPFSIPINSFTPSSSLQNLNDPLFLSLPHTIHIQPPLLFLLQTLLSLLFLFLRIISSHHPITLFLQFLTLFHGPLSPSIQSISQFFLFSRFAIASSSPDSRRLHLTAPRIQPPRSLSPAPYGSTSANGTADGEREW